MITRVKTYNRFSMDRLAEKGHLSGFPFCDQNWALISIHSDAGDDGLSSKYLTPDVVEILKGLGMVDHLSLRFWDITDDPELLESMNQYGHNYVLFDEGMAKAIIEFADRLIARQEEVVLVVHCDAGVAQFVTERARLDLEAFWAENRSLMPNPFVKRVLRGVAGVELMSAEEVRVQKAAEAAMDKLLDLGVVFV
jgi:hypothetical protein